MSIDGGDNNKYKIKNYSIERDFLSGLVHYPEALYEIESRISDQDFLSKVWGKVYSVIRNLIIDKDITKLDSAIILATISTFGFTFPPECNITDSVEKLVANSKSIELKTIALLAKEIVLLSRRREMYECGSKMQRNMMDGHKFGSIQEIISVSDEIYFDTVNDFIVDDDMVQLGTGAGEILHQRADAPIDHVGFGTGFKHYDELIGYIRPDSFNFISGRGKAGKSMWGLNVARHVAQFENYPVFYADSEMTSVMVRDRLIAHVSSVDITLIENGRWKSNPEVCARVQKAIPIVENLNIQYFSIRATNSAGMISACRRFLFRKVKRNSQQLFNPCLFVWDYIKLDYYNSDNMGSSWWLDIAKSVVHFKDFLGKTQTAALVLGQQNQSGIAKLDKNQKLVTQDNESVVAGSDEIVKTASNVSQIRFKTPEEVKRDGADAGDCILMPFVCRTGRGGSWVQVSEGMFEREYVCLKRHAEKMTFEEITTNKIIRMNQDLGSILESKTKTEIKPNATNKEEQRNTLNS